MIPAEIHEALRACHPVVRDWFHETLGEPTEPQIRGWPLIREGKPIGCLAVLDKRDGGPYLREDLSKVMLFADLAVVALDLDTFPLSSSGGRTLLA